MLRATCPPFFITTSAVCRCSVWWRAIWPVIRHVLSNKHRHNCFARDSAVQILDKQKIFSSVPANHSANRRFNLLKINIFPSRKKFSTYRLWILATDWTYWVRFSVKRPERLSGVRVTPSSVGDGPWLHEGKDCRSVKQTTNYKMHSAQTPRVIG